MGGEERKGEKGKGERVRRVGAVFHSREVICFSSSNNGPRAATGTRLAGGGIHRPVTQPEKEILLREKGFGAGMCVICGAQPVS